MRPTISEIARRADVPRRTVQFWFDNEAIAEGELELVRMLRPFSVMKAPIAVVKLLAGVFRDHVLDERYADADAIEEFAPAVAAARAGRAAYVLVQMFEGPEAAVRAATGVRELRDLVVQLTGTAPVIVINLTEALHNKAEGSKNAAR